MFKSVEYVGFEGQPDARSAAELCTQILGDVVRSWRDRVSVQWRPLPESSRNLLELTLGLSLSGVDARATGLVRRQSLTHGAAAELRSDLREAWLDVLGEISARQMGQLEAALGEPVVA